jgi:hypothetical protein
MKPCALLSVALCAGVLAGAGHACLNDRDSDLLEKEGRSLPGAMQVITGRFERNPPLFFEMRLQRVASQLKKKPHSLPLYDDAAVASDRLGRSDEALAWMEKKHAQLLQRKPFEQLDAKNAVDKTLREQWYRYYANTGTFRAHRWIAAGANRASIREMKQAAGDIATAIKIKPNAHFGREKYQLMAMKWIIAPPQNKQPRPTLLGLNQSLASAFSGNLPGAENELQHRGLTDAVQGLTGLVVLGNAWESLDVFLALREPLQLQGKGSLAELARLRSIELMHQGKRSLDLSTSNADLMNGFKNSMSRPVPYSSQQIQEIYTRLRTEANEYQQKRTAYMMARLEQGQHPDSHSAFWSEWQDAGPPAPVPFTFWEKHGSAMTIIAVALLGSLVMLFQVRRRYAAPARA